MKLLIGIATYKRPEKLLRCLESIKNSTYKNVEINIVADNNDNESRNPYLFAYNEGLNITKFSVQDSHRFVIGAWNKIVKDNIENDFDGFIGLVDDIELTPNALQIIVNRHQDHFYDTDGVVGFNQKCPGHPEYTFKWFGQTLMGRKFVERYKEAQYQICCPFYKWSHQDEEMYNYAQSLCKFFSCEEAVIKHYHPCFIKEEIDETHKILREGNSSIRNHDLNLFNKRKKEKRLWGKTWEK